MKIIIVLYFLAMVSSFHVRSYMLKNISIFGSTRKLGACSQWLEYVARIASLCEQEKKKDMFLSKMWRACLHKAKKVWPIPQMMSSY